MALVQFNNIKKILGAEEILQGVDGTIHAGSRIGLVGSNGSGKTTLLRILLGEMEQDEGEVLKQKNLKTAYLSQISDIDGTKTVWQYALEGNHQILELEEAIDKIEKKIVTANDEEVLRLIEEQAEYWEKFEQVGGYRYQNLTESVLEKLGFQKDLFHLPANVLSGGQKNRLGLVCALLKESQLLFLDEPTNFLDVESTEWLEGYLCETSSAVLVISHDRYFLNKVAKEIWEIRGGRLFRYRGNYDAYLKLKEKQQKEQQERFERQQAEIRRQEEFITRNIVGQKHKQAQSRRKMLEKMEKVEAPIQDASTMKTFKIESKQALSDRVIETEKIGHSFSEKEKALFQNTSFSLHQGEKLAIVGPNGCGKTTFLRIISGDFPPTEGKIKRSGKLDIGFYRQELEGLIEENSVFDTLKNLAPTVDDKPLRDFLARFLFRGDDIYKKVEKLSGGEKSRLALSQLLLQKPNFLILDEPTNHLDIPSRQALEESLQEYNGALLFVSHDRYFIDKVATRLLVFHEKQWINFYGNYSSFSESKKNILPESPEESKKKREAYLQAEKRRQKRSKQKKKYTLDELEEKIIHGETRLEEITEELGSEACYSNPEKVKQLKQEYDELSVKLEEWNQEWETWE